MARKPKLFYILIFLCPVVFLSGCRQTSPGETISEMPAFHPAISGFSSGSISTTSAITILLSQDYRGDFEPLAPLGERLFEFTPAIKGTAVWIDSRTIEFRPDERLPSGKQFRVNFLVGKLFELPREERTFSFSFRTILQSFSVEIDGLQPYSISDPAAGRLGGTLFTADLMEEKELLVLLKASQQGRSLPVKWEQDASGRKHMFVVDSIRRLETRSEVMLAFEGKAAGIDQSEDLSLKVPALGDFSITEVRVVQQPEQYVSIRFSDPLQRNQNLNGLISLQGAENLRFLIDVNEVRVYPGMRLNGAVTLVVSEGIRSQANYRFSEAAEYHLAFEDIKPALRLTGKGVILPASEGLIFPFEAVNLKAVEVRVIRIYEDNIAQFLQVNNLSGEEDIRRAGRLVLRQTINLAQGRQIDNGRWNTFSLDLSRMIQAEPGAIYRVELGFNRSHSIFPCPGQEATPDDITSMDLPWDSDLERELAYWDNPESWYDGYSYYSEWNWNEMDNPCHDAYYGRRRWVARNILASDLGIIAKAGTGNHMTFAVSDLRSTQPLANVTLEIYNYQQRLISTVQTGRDGMASVQLDAKPFLLIARHNTQRGYLRLDDASSLSLSRFDVSGNRVQRGLKGYIYGERGVWRPGDSLFVTFIMEDKMRQLPQGHPVVFELINPLGQLVQRISRTQSENGFYNFSTATRADAPTGNWMGKVTVGGVNFSRVLKVEAIKPNRLKLDMDFGEQELLTPHASSARLKASWLHGAVARNLRANVAVTLRQMKTQFPGFTGFVFDDPARSFESEEVTIFDGRINEEGRAQINPDLGVQRNAPGMLRAGFVVRVFEESGDFSIDRFSIPYSPFQHYVGIRAPGGNNWQDMLETGSDHLIEVATVDAQGKPVSRNNLEVQVYKVEWRWWWDASEENLASYIGSSRARPVFSQKISTRNGKGSFQFRIDQPEWGRYLIRISDPASGHSTGQIVFVDWPGWDSRARAQDPSAAAMLSFTTDKQSYKVGEAVSVNLPAGREGRALVSIESGSRVLRSWWVEARGEETRFSFPASAEMAPNAFIHVSLVQPHARMTNDLPIRLYGVIPLLVEDPATQLQPLLELPESLSPEQTAVIKVKEAAGKKMTYTLALVDEGLLDLTRFNTPDPWSAFYAREALGVKTWDMYDFVLGAYGGRIERVFSIGGDEDAGARPETQANRFPPMVRFLGPFTLEKGKTASHTVSIPKYVGSVRVMVVAGDQGAYGKAEKTVPVKNPLMVLATLPRVLTPGESVKLPVTVFAMEADVQNVHVEVITNGLLPVKGEKSRQLRFTRTGEQMVQFELDVASAIGRGSVRVIASSGRHKAEYDIEIDVRNPNQPITRFTDALVEAGQQWSADYQPVGIQGTNSALLEISSIPPVDFGRRLKYLVSYPHGCAEQVTSGAFPQLFLESVMEIDARMKAHIRENVISALRILASYQRPSGGIGYWPGASEAADWASTYAGHFMLEAEARGYGLPVGMRDNWLRFQRSQARNWAPRNQPGNNHQYDMNDLMQAYRLYTLALAGQPELGAMNRLRETTGISLQARWRLAAAYALAGQPEAARQLTEGVSASVSSYSPFNSTYGSRERDLAMILETLSLMNRREEAIPLVQIISQALTADTWMSTQTTAYCLLAMAKFASQGTTAQMEFEYRINDNAMVKVSSSKPLLQIPLDIPQTASGSLMVKNNSKGVMFARLVLTGIPETGAVMAEENNLRIQLSYRGMDGKPLNIGSLAQGTDFMAEVTVTNPGQMGNYTNLVLTQVFPSGWEIHNRRMDEVTSVHQANVPTYEDIRDDRVHTHFDLAAGQTKKFIVVVNAAYLGRFYLPGVFCEAMYNNRVSARKPGQWVEVVIPGMN